MGGKDEIDKDDRECEDEERSRTCQPFLIRHGGPFVAHACREYLVGKASHELHSLTGTIAGGRCSLNGGSGIHIVERDHGRAVVVIYGGQRAEWDHFALVVADGIGLDGLLVSSECSIGLRKDVKVHAKHSELIHIA